MFPVQLDYDRLLMVAEEALEDSRKRFFLVAVSSAEWHGAYEVVRTFLVVRGFRDDFLRFP